jgi:hypothetical protein
VYFDAARNVKCFPFIISTLVLYTLLWGEYQSTT